jgi:hypothetical protein
MRIPALRHSIVPSLNWDEDTDAFLAIDTRAEPVGKIDEFTQRYQLRCREASSGQLSVDFNPGNSARAVLTNECNQLLGVFENIYNGIDAVVYFSTEPLSSITVTLNIMLLNRYNNTSYYGKFDESSFSWTGALEDCYSNVHLFPENGHYFMLIEDYGLVGRHLLVDIFPNTCSALSTTSLRVDNQGFTRPDRNFIIRNPNQFAAQQINVRNLVSRTPSTRYFNPSLSVLVPTANDFASYTYTFSPAISGMANGEVVSMLCYQSSYLRDSNYYPVNARMQKLTLPTGETSLRIPDEMASPYYIGEYDNRGFLYSDTPILTQENQGGKAVVTDGVPADVYFTQVSSPEKVQTPITATNNVFNKGYNFLQWIQAKASPFNFTLLSAKLITRITLQDGVYLFSQSGTPHIRVGASSSAPTAFYANTVSEFPIAGVIQATGTSAYNALRGDFMTHLSMPQSNINNEGDCINSAWVPFASLGRTLHGITTKPYYTPLFGLKISQINKFLSVGDGRLAAVVNNATLYISSPVRTNYEFPSFLDFQVRINPVTPQFNAEIYQLNCKSIHDIVVSQTGYLVATSDGIFDINSITGVISKLIDTEINWLSFSAGLYVAVGVSDYYVVNYNDQTKQYDIIKHGTLHPDIQTLIGNNHYFITRSKNRRYIKQSNQVLYYRSSAGLVLFLDENNILNLHRHPSQSFSVTGRYVIACFNANTPQNQWVHTYPGYLGNNENNFNRDIIANSVTGNVTKANLGIVDTLSVFLQKYALGLNIKFDTLQQVNDTLPILTSGSNRRFFNSGVLTNLKTIHPDINETERGVLTDQKQLDILFQGFSDAPNIPFYRMSQAIYQDKFATLTQNSNLTLSTPNNLISQVNVPQRVSYNRTSILLLFAGKIRELYITYMLRRSNRSK